MLKLADISIKLNNFYLNNVTLQVNQGDYYVLLGESGAGKTLLLEIIAGISQPDSGIVYYNNVNITDLAIQSRQFGLVYQSQALFPHLSVYNNIAYALKSRKLSKLSIYNKVAEISEELSIKHLWQRNTATLSGGEAQRIALARALIFNPDLILLDEPLSSLDHKNRSGIRSILRRISRKGKTIIHVTHDYEEALALANRVAILENGTVSQEGSVDHIFQNPVSEFAAKFTGIKNFYTGQAVKKENKILFSTDNIDFILNQDIENLTPVCPGKIIIKRSDITLSLEKPKTSAQNVFNGRVIDIEKIKTGNEIHIDIGRNIIALITDQALLEMNISINKNIWVSIKASAVKFIAD